MANTVIRLGFLSITTGGGAGFEEYANLAAFPLIGQAETIYVALDTNKTYRWSGSTYVEISPSEVISVNSKVGVVVLTKSDIGLSNVDNTSDANKPISNATQAALDLITDVNWTGDYNNGVTYNVGDGVMYNGASFRMVSFIGAAGYIPPAYPANWVQVTDYVSPNDIGLGNVDNTSDLDKPISNDTQDALDLKVDKAGDTMTGQLVMQDSSILVDYTTTNSIPTTIEIENDLIQSTVINGDITTSSNITSKSHTLVRTDVSTLTADKTVQLGGDDVYTILTATVNNTVDNYNTSISIDEVGLYTEFTDSNTGDLKLGTYHAGTFTVQTSFGDGTAISVVANEDGLSLTTYDGFNTNPFIPTQPEQVATKKYVDDQDALKADVVHNHDLSAINQSGANIDQFPKWDGSNWVASDISASVVTYTPDISTDWVNVPAVSSEALDELASRVTNLDQNSSNTSSVFVDMKEPTGFVNRTDSEISFDNSTRIFTIQPTGLSYSIYHLGVKTIIDTPLSITIPDNSGNYYIYISNSANLTYTTTFDLALISEYAYCAYIYWDDVDNKAVIFGDERHGITMDGTTHAYLHTTRGTQLVSGAAIGYTLGSGALAADAQISLGDMQIKDEDITVNINNDATPDAPFEQILFPIAEIPIVYREGTIWKKSVATQFPMIVQSGDVRASYNEFTGSTWQLTEAPSNNKTLVTYIFATTSVDEPVIGILGQTQYNNIDEARGDASWENISFGDLPSPEMKLLYTLYYDTSSGYANAAKSKITYVADLRFTHDREVSAAVFNSDHANLSGLANDDHTQYHNNTRGDARYNLKSTGDISETSFSILNNQSSAQPITGFSFSNATVRSFTALASVKIEATSNLYEVFEIKGIQKDSDWNISIQSSGDISGVSFYISSLGQMEYTSSNYTGFISGVIKFKAFTTSI